MFVVPLPFYLIVFTCIYQPPFISPQHIPGLAAAPPVAPPRQTSAAPPIQTPAAVPLPTYSPLPQMAPYSGSIPTIPARFATTATSGEFVDFNKLLHALESEGTEEISVQIELGEDNRLTLPRKSRRDRSPPLSYSGQGAVLSTPTICPPTSHSGQRTSWHTSTSSPHAMQSTIYLHAWRMFLSGDPPLFAPNCCCKHD